MSGKIRVAIVGCGDIAETGHAPALMRHDRFELVATCDVVCERTKRLADTAGVVATYTDYRALLDHPEIDAVILALHPEVSVDVAIEFLRRGVPVLDEKPLAATWDDGQRLLRCVAETRSVYQIGFVLRTCGLVRDATRLARAVGSPSFCHVSIYDERFDPNNTLHFQRIQKILRHSSAFTHQASHVLDFYRLWNSAPLIGAHASAITTDDAFHGPNVWDAVFHAADDSVLRVTVGWLLPSLLPSRISMCGPRGGFELDIFSGLGSATIDRQSSTIRSEALTQDWQTQLDRFAHAIDQGQASVATVYDGLNALAGTLACEESVTQKQLVMLEPVEV